MTQYSHISQKQLDGAKIYSNRWEWVASLPHNLDIIEVGVGSGDYSWHMMQTIKPKTLTLIDLYNQSDPGLARPGMSKRFFQDGHYDFIADRFKEYDNVNIIKGNSNEVLFDLSNTDQKFDVIYIDACHHYKESATDIMHASKLLRDGGILAINDYVKYVDLEQYGVILATNEFLRQNPEWHVVGLALEESMMADIYLSKYPQ